MVALQRFQQMETGLLASIEVSEILLLDYLGGAPPTVCEGNLQVDRQVWYDSDDVLGL
jgi:hypothetical protein